LEENVGAAEITLSVTDLKEINEAVAKIEVQGARYPDQLQKMVNR
jgi:aryl-alcohol dehydrogenase-like predicted oxidoreductase